MDAAHSTSQATVDAIGIACVAWQTVAIAVTDLVTGCVRAVTAPVMRRGKTIFASVFMTTDGYAVSRDRVSTRSAALAVQGRRAVVAGISTESCGY